MYADCEVYIIIYLYTAKCVLKMTCLSGTCRLQKNEFFVRASAKGVKGAHCTCIPLWNFKSWKRSSEVLSYCLMSNKKQSATLS